MPAIPSAVLTALIGLSRLVSGRGWVLSVAALVIVQIGGNVRFASTSSEGAPFWVSWFERTNRIHHRDIFMTERLRYWVDEIGKAKPGVVSILTGQMGFVAYHLSQTHYGRVRFIDKFGLATRDFFDCPYGRQLPRGRVGLRLPYKRVFQDWTTIERTCHVPIPDIIFDVYSSGAMFPSVINDNGYVIVFEQSDQLLSVRGDLFFHPSWSGTTLKIQDTAPSPSPASTPRHAAINTNVNIPNLSRHGQTTAWWLSSFFAPVGASAAPSEPGVQGTGAVRRIPHLEAGMSEVPRKEAE